MDLHAPEASAHDAEPERRQHVPLEAECLQHGTPGEDELHVTVAFHGDATETKLAEARERGATREAGRDGEPQEAEVEAGQRRHAQQRGRKVLVKLERRAVDEKELLHALDGKELEPARDTATVTVHVAAGEVGAAERAAVRVEDTGDGGDHGVRVGALHVSRDLVLGAAREEVGVVEDEWRGAPHGEPAAGEDGRARPVLDGEARDDVVEEGVGEAAEPVGAAGVGVGVGEGAEATVDGDGWGREGAVDAAGERAGDERVEMWVPAPIGGRRRCRRS